MILAAPPARTEVQRRTALTAANEVRSRRAVLKVELGQGHIHLADVLASEEDWMQSMRVGDALQATPKLGRVKVEVALRICRIPLGRTIGALSQPQLTNLFYYLREAHPTIDFGVLPR